MAVKIRLRRTGANNDISFRVVAIEGHTSRDGRSIEVLGWYDPKRASRNFEIKADRYNYWVGKGAVVSDTVRSLVKSNKPKA